MSESNKKTKNLDILSNFYISVDIEENNEENLGEDEHIIVINNIGDINTIDFNFKTPVKINKYKDVDESNITYSFVIFGRNEKTSEWNLLFYKKYSENVYSNLEGKYKNYKWFIV
jgi:hypothetical protein